MKLPLLFRILPSATALGLTFLAPRIGAAEPATTGSSDQLEALFQAATTHEYYAKLAKLSGEPASPQLAIDKQRHATTAARAEEILARKPHYLTVPVDTFKVAPPPANSSSQTRAELDYLLRLQEQRTPMEMAANLDLMNWGYVLAVQPTDRDFGELRSNFFRVGRSLGTWFNHDKLPKTGDFVARVWQDARYYMWSLKLQYARARPYHLEPKIKNLQDTDWPAYPSGHATYAYMLAYLYSAISPKHTDLFIHDAYMIAHSREIIGVHYPSDSESGRVLAQQLLEHLSKNESFAQDLKTVQAEWDQVAQDNL